MALKSHQKYDFKSPEAPSGIHIILRQKCHLGFTLWYTGLTGVLPIFGRLFIYFVISLLWSYRRAGVCLLVAAKNPLVRFASGSNVPALIIFCADCFFFTPHYQPVFGQFFGKEKIKYFLGLKSKIGKKSPVLWRLKNQELGGFSFFDFGKKWKSVWGNFWDRYKTHCSTRIAWESAFCTTGVSQKLFAPDSPHPFWIILTKRQKIELNFSGNENTFGQHLSKFRDHFLLIQRGGGGTILLVNTSSAKCTF